MVKRLVNVVESRMGFQVSLIILGVVLWPGAAWLYADRTPPVKTFISSEVQNSPVGVGEPLRLRVFREKMRDDCPVTAHRTAVDQDGRVYTISTASWAGGDDDAPFVDLAYDLPASMPDGDYVLFVSLTYECPGPFVFHYEQPPALFRLRRGS